MTFGRPRGPLDKEREHCLNKEVKKRWSGRLSLGRSQETLGNTCEEQEPKEIRETEFERKHESAHTQKIELEQANDTTLEIYLSGLICESDSQLTEED